MRRVSAVLMVLTLSAVGASAQMKPKPATSSGNPIQLQLQPSGDLPLESAKRIDRAEAIKLVRSGKAVYVDVRSRHSYETAHIPGAISIPQSQLGSLLGLLPPNKTIITYCACEEEHTAAMAVIFYNKHGITNTAALRGGWNEWLSSKQPIASGPR